MPYGFGRNVMGTTGSTLQVAAVELEEMDWKVAGVTIDYATVPAQSGAPVTLLDGNVIPVGAKYLRYGQVLCRITASGLFGPYDPAAADGRQTLTQGDCYVLNETVTELPLLGFVAPQSLHLGGVFDGGYVWLARLLQAGTGAASLAAGPTLAAFKAAFPRIAYVAD